MNALILAVAFAAAQIGTPPYPYGYTLADHYHEYGYQGHTYPTQAAYDAARLRWDSSGKSLSTGVNVGFGQ